MSCLTAWAHWFEARSLCERAAYLCHPLAREAERARAQRLWRRALRLLGSERDVAELELRVEAERLTHWQTCPPVVKVRCWIRQHPHFSRSFAASLLVASIGLVLWGYRVELGLSRNLALGRPWRASSAYPGLPIAGTLGAPTEEAFFHTNFEGSPSVVIDLGQRRTFARIRVWNRLDCCQNRAVPLLVEGSDDAQSWRALALRRSLFTLWDLRIPAFTSRFVRFRVPRASYAHFSHVGVYR